MRPKGVHILSLEKDDRDDSGRPRKWNYKLKSYDHFRTPGAFRAVSVEALRRTHPKIKLYEWPKLKTPNSEIKDKNKFPVYAAISHVWQASDEVGKLVKFAKSDHLKILVEGDRKDETKTNTIRWLGLRQIADAAHELYCDYFWLDLLCMDQVPRPDPGRENDGEKALQITNMANIYKRAKTVIVMVGGAGAVQKVDKPSPWMDRAWTLQEAAIGPGVTWVYVQCPSEPRFGIDTISVPKKKFIRVTGETDNYLIELVYLLEMLDLSKAMTTLPGFEVKCLDGCGPGQAGDKARTALLAVLKGTEESKKAGIWRSMLMRTSSNPVDIVYSVSGLFGVELDPYRKDRNVQYLFNDLATKTAAKGSPGWFGIGGVEGSLTIRIRNRKSHLMPRIPLYPKEALPFYKLGRGRPLTSEFIDGSKNYISRFNIRFITSSQPHIICAQMLKITEHSISYPFRGSKPDQYRIDLSFGSRLRGTCTYRGVQSDTIVVVGTIGSWSNPPSSCTGHYHILFMSWNSKQWTLKGDGYLRLKAGGKLPETRYHFTVGEGSPKIWRWSCDHKVAATKQILHYSYGIMPRPYLGPDPYQKRRPIEWFGSKGKSSEDKPWHQFNIYFNNPTNKKEMDNQGRNLPSSWPLCLVASNSRDRPEFLDKATPGSLFGPAKIPMEYGGRDLGRASTDISNKIQMSRSPFSPAGFYAKVEFRKHVVYLKTKPEKEMDCDFDRIAVAPYYR